ncbi:MAG TPA: HD domain-containing protein [Acidimicrobiia bacterium]|jgi:(p)ppGpp synthase/HD superfamily hydrolase
MPADDPASNPVSNAGAVLSDRFASAVDWAIELHCDQTRKGTGVPYVAHLIEVAALVLHDGGTESEAIAGLLHDAIEDAGVKPKQIRKRYGRKVSRIVKACTETIDGKLPGASKAPRDASTWRARKQEAIDHLADLDTPTPVLRVKAADALANARSIVADLRRTGPEVWQRFHAGAIDQLWYYRSLTVILVARHPGTLSDELRASVTEMEQLSRWWFDVGDPQPGSD